jgi:hypothetical protein
MGHAVVGASLCSHELREWNVAHTWRAIIVYIACVAGDAQICTGQGCDGSTKAVACDDKVVRRIVGFGALYAGKHLGLNLIVGCVEAGVYQTAGHQAARDLVEYKTIFAISLRFLQLRKIQTHSVIQFCADELPLKETTMSPLLASVATKPSKSVTFPLRDH